MADFETKARQYVAQGDKKLRSFGFFSNKYEEAADLYEKGANQFKLAKACGWNRRAGSGALCFASGHAHCSRGVAQAGGPEAAFQRLAVARCWPPCRRASACLIQGGHSCTGRAAQKRRAGRLLLHKAPLSLAFALQAALHVDSWSNFLRPRPAANSHKCTPVWAGRLCYLYTLQG